MISISAEALIMPDELNEMRHDGEAGDHYKGGDLRYARNGNNA